MMSSDGYAHPEFLIDTETAQKRLEDPNLRFVEVDVDTGAYESGHIPGAVGWDWQRDTQDMLVRDILDKKGFQDLMGRSGIANDTTVVLYGDTNNWFAAFAFWLLTYYGHSDALLLDGGRVKWLEEGRPMISEVPAVKQSNYSVKGMNQEVRALRDDVLQALRRDQQMFVDVRSPEEFSGQLLAPENLPQEGSQRGGHIPGARNIPWSKAVREDGTFKPAEELRDLYGGEGITSADEVIAYCRIGERSSHTWFALRYLLGLPNVRNYDGSWTEYGSLIGVPIEKP